MRFLTPLRKPTAVLLSLALLPWRPLAALAADGGDVPPPAFSTEEARIAREAGVELAKPGEALAALAKDAAARLADLRRDDLAAREAAALGPAFAALLERFPKRDRPLQSLSPAARAVVEGSLAAAATSHALLAAVVERELPKARVELVAARDGLGALDKARETRGEAEWVALEKAASSAPASLRAAADLLRAARQKTPPADRAAASELESLHAALEGALKALEARLARADFAAQLAARPRGKADAAAEELLRAASEPLKGDPKLLRRLTGAQSSLSLFLRGGDEAQLATAIAEMARAYDAAGVPKSRQAELFAAVGRSASRRSAEVRAQSAADVPAAPAAGPKSLINAENRRVRDTGLSVPGLPARDGAAPAAAAVSPLEDPRLLVLRDAVSAAASPFSAYLPQRGSPLVSALDGLPGRGALGERLEDASAALLRGSLAAELEGALARLRALGVQEAGVADRASLEALARAAEDAVARGEALRGRDGYTALPAARRAALDAALAAARELVARLALRSRDSDAAAAEAERSAEAWRARARRAGGDWRAAWDSAPAEAPGLLPEDAARRRAAWDAARAELGAGVRAGLDARFRAFADEIAAAWREAPGPSDPAPARAAFIGRWTALLERLNAPDADAKGWAALLKDHDAAAAAGGPLAGAPAAEKARAEELVRLALWALASGVEPTGLSKEMRAVVLGADGRVAQGWQELIASRERDEKTFKRLPELLGLLSGALERGERLDAFFDGAQVKALLASDPRLRGAFEGSNFGALYAAALSAQGGPRAGADARGVLARALRLREVPRDEGASDAQLDLILQSGFADYGAAAYAFLAARRERDGYRDKPAVATFLSAWEAAGAQGKTPEAGALVDLALAARAALAATDGGTMVDLRVEALKRQREMQQSLSALDPAREDALREELAAVRWRERRAAALRAEADALRERFIASEGADLAAKTAYEAKLSSAAGLAEEGRPAARVRADLAEVASARASLAELSAFLRDRGLIGEDEVFSPRQLELVARNRAAVTLALTAREYLASLSRESPEAYRREEQRLTAWWRLIRETALSDIGRGAWEPPVAARLRAWSGSASDPAAVQGLTRTISELAAPGMLSLAYLRRVKELSGREPGRVPPSAAPLLDDWRRQKGYFEQVSASLDEQARFFERGARWVAGEDAASWAGEPDQERRDFLEKVVGKSLAEWRAIQAQRARGGAPERERALSEFAASLRAQAAELIGLSRELRAASALSDPAASLKTFRRAYDFLGRSGNAPPFEVLDEAWARAAAADPKARESLARRYAEGERDRLLLTSLQQHQDFLRRQVGENLRAFLDAKLGKPAGLGTRALDGVAAVPGMRLLAGLERSYLGLKSVEDRLARFSAEDREDGARLFLGLQRAGADLKFVLADRGYASAALYGRPGVELERFTQAADPSIARLRVGAAPAPPSGPGGVPRPSGLSGEGVTVVYRSAASPLESARFSGEERQVFTSRDRSTRVTQAAAATGDHAQFLRVPAGFVPGGREEALTVFVDRRTGAAFTRDASGARREAAAAAGDLRVHTYVVEDLRRGVRDPERVRSSGAYAAASLSGDGSAYWLTRTDKGQAKVDLAGRSRVTETTYDGLRGVERIKWDEASMSVRPLAAKDGQPYETKLARTADGEWVSTARYTREVVRDESSRDTGRRRDVVETRDPAAPEVWLRYDHDGRGAARGKALSGSVEVPVPADDARLRAAVSAGAARRAVSTLGAALPLAHEGKRPGEAAALLEAHLRGVFDGARRGPEGAGFVSVGADGAVYSRTFDDKGRAVEYSTAHRVLKAKDAREYSVLPVSRVTRGADGKTTTTLQGALVYENGRVQKRDLSTWHNVESNDWFGGVLLGRTHTDQTGFSIGGSSLVLQEKERRFYERSGTFWGTLNDYGLLGVVTLQPATDAVGLAVESALIAMDVDPAKARFYGEAVAGGLDLVAGMMTMGPAMLKLSQMAMKYGRMARALYVAGTGGMLYMGIRGTVGAADTLVAGYREGDWTKAGIGLRGILGNADMLVSPFANLSMQGWRPRIDIHPIWKNKLNLPDAPRDGGGPPKDAAPPAEAGPPRGDGPPKDVAPPAPGDGGVRPAPNDGPRPGTDPPRFDPPAPGLPGDGAPPPRPPVLGGADVPAPAAPGATAPRGGVALGRVDGSGVAASLGDPARAAGPGDVAVGPQSVFFGAGAPAAKSPAPAPAAPVSAAPAAPAPAKTSASPAPVSVAPASRVADAAVKPAADAAPGPVREAASAPAASGEAVAALDMGGRRAASVAAAPPGGALKTAPLESALTGRDALPVRDADGKPVAPAERRAANDEDGGLASAAAPLSAAPQGLRRVGAVEPPVRVEASASAAPAPARELPAAARETLPIREAATVAPRESVRLAEAAGSPALDAAAASRLEQAAPERAAAGELRPGLLRRAVGAAQGAFDKSAEALNVVAARLDGTPLQFVGDLASQSALVLRGGLLDAAPVRRATDSLEHGASASLWLRHDPRTGAVLEVRRASPGDEAGAWSSLTVGRGPRGLEVLGREPLAGRGGVEPSAYARRAHEFAAEAAVRDPAARASADALFASKEFRDAIKAREDPDYRVSEVPVWWDAAARAWSLEPRPGAAEGRLLLSPEPKSDRWRALDARFHGDVPAWAQANLLAAFDAAAPRGYDMSPGLLERLRASSPKRLTAAEADALWREREAGRNREMLDAARVFREASRAADAELTALREAGDREGLLARAEALRPRLEELAASVRERGGDAEHAGLARALRALDAARAQADPADRELAVAKARRELAAAQRDADALGVGGDLRSAARRRVEAARRSARQAGLDPDALDAVAALREAHAALRAAPAGDVPARDAAAARLAAARREVDFLSARGRGEPAAVHELGLRLADALRSGDPARLEAARRAVEEAGPEAAARVARLEAREASVLRLEPSAQRRELALRRESARAELAAAEDALRSLGADPAGLDRAAARGEVVAARARELDARAQAAAAQRDAAPAGAVRDEAAGRLERLLDERARLHSAARAAAAQGREALGARVGSAPEPAVFEQAARRQAARLALDAADAELGALRSARRSGGADASAAAAAEYRAALRAAAAERRAALDSQAYRRRAMTAEQADLAASRALREARGRARRGDDDVAGARVEYQGDGAMTCSLRALANQLGTPFDGLAAVVRRRLGGDFLARVEREGLDPAEIRTVAKLLALETGRVLESVAPGEVFSAVASGRDVVVVINYAAGVNGGGGPHAVNLRGGSIRDVSGRTVIEFQDSLVNGQGRPVRMALADFVPLLTRAGGLTFGDGPLPAAARARYEADVDALARAVAAGGVVARVGDGGGVRPPEGFPRAAKTLDPGLLDPAVGSPAARAMARAEGRVFDVTAENLHRLAASDDDVRFNYVIAREPDGSVVMTVGRRDPDDLREKGVKHAALGAGRPVLFAGEVVYRPKTGLLRLDFNSGTYSQVGRDAAWTATRENATALKAYARAILGREPTFVWDHLKGRRVETAPLPSLLPARPELLAAASEGPARVGAAELAPGARLVRLGTSRGAPLDAGGTKVERVSGGSFKDVYAHPADDGLVLKVFNQAGADTRADSVAEARRERRGNAPLEAIRRAPRIVGSGTALFEAGGRTREVAYVAQQRFRGRDLAVALREGPPESRAAARAEARALVEDLVKARLKLEDATRFGENVAIGRLPGDKTDRAYVLDAGEVSRAPEPGLLDRALGRPDPLRAYYDGLLRALERGSGPVRVGASEGGGFLGRLFGGGAPAPARRPAVPEAARWYVEDGAHAPRIPAGVVTRSRLASADPVHQANVYAAEVDGRPAVVKLNATPNEPKVLAAMNAVELPANVRVPRVLGAAPAGLHAAVALGDAARVLDSAALGRAEAEGRWMMVMERLPDDFVSLRDVLLGAVKLGPVSKGDWQGLLDAAAALQAKGLGFGDLNNATNIRVRQVPGEDGRARTEFALIDAGRGTLRGNPEILAGDRAQLKGAQGYEAQLSAKGLLEAPGYLADPQLTQRGRNIAPQHQAMLDALNRALALSGPAAPRAAGAAAPGEGRFTPGLEGAVARLRETGADTVAILEKTADGIAGDAVKVTAGGATWYLKRVSKASKALDADHQALSPRDRAANEVGMREVVRRWFPGSFGVAPESLAFAHGGETFVMTKGAPAAPDDARYRSLPAKARADYAVLKLVFRAEDLNKGNVLFGEAGAKPVLIDFEKVVAEPLPTARLAPLADNDVVLKSFPLVARREYNDPAVYREAVAPWRARFADAAFRAEFESLLLRSGWDEARVRKYMDAVDYNLANFERHLQVYLDVAVKYGAPAAPGAPPPGAAGPRGPPARPAFGKRVGAAETLAANAAVLARVEAQTPFKGVAHRPPEWAAVAEGLPVVALTRVLSQEGSTGPILEGRMASGERVAVKALRAPAQRMSWKQRVDDAVEEAGFYRELESALPPGWAPKGHGLVDTGGSPAMAMGVIEGKDPHALTVREALAIPEVAIDQVAAATMLLNRRGIYGVDSPQEMVLTRDQVINGVPRKAGEVVFMDAGAFTRKPSEGYSGSPRSQTEPLLFYRALARLYGQDRLDMSVEALAKSLPNEKRIDLVNRTREAAMKRPLPDLSRFAAPADAPRRVGDGGGAPLREKLGDVAGDRQLDARLLVYEKSLEAGDVKRAYHALRSLEIGVEKRHPEAVFEKASVRDELLRLEALVKAEEARVKALADAHDVATRLDAQRAAVIADGLDARGLAGHFNASEGVFSSGVDGAHREPLFSRTLGTRGIEVAPRRSVPGHPGLELVTYKLYRRLDGRQTAELRGKPMLKTLFDAALWPDARVESFGREIFSGVWPAKKAELQRRIAADELLTPNVELKVEVGKVVFVGWVDWRTGRLISYGVDEIRP